MFSSRPGNHLPGRFFSARWILTELVVAALVGVIKARKFVIALKSVEADAFSFLTPARFGPEESEQKGIVMNIVYNSDNYAIVAYPTRQAFELVDKLSSRSLFVQGSVAKDLRSAIDSIPDEDRDQESIDSLLDDFCAGAARPITVH